jgi:hypothetical protein
VRDPHYDGSSDDSTILSEAKDNAQQHKITAVSNSERYVGSSGLTTVAGHQTAMAEAGE